MATSIEQQYLDAVQSFVDFARTIGDDEWSTPVPCTPEWTARDVLSHVSGTPDDGLAGRTDGAGSDPWTQAQVERNADLDVDFLIERLLAQYELFAHAIEEMGEPRPPIDCHSHEHDLRHALGRPGNRDSAIVAATAERLLIPFGSLPVSLTVTFEDGSEHRVGASDAERHAELSTTRFEMFRSRLGRRTREQVRSLEWSGDTAAIDAAVDSWFLFGPNDTAVDE